MSPTATSPQKPARRRLDQLLVERGLAETRSRGPGAAPRRPGPGRGGRRGSPRPQGRRPRRRRRRRSRSSQREPYVSRGGHKLAAALDAFGIDPAGRICLDVGASTGGFTDVLLQRGARARLRGRRRARPARRAAPPRRAGRLDGADERPDARPRQRCRSPSTSPSSTSRSSRSGSSSGPSRRRSGRRRARRSSPSSSPSSRPAAGRTDHGVVRDPAVHREVLERVVATAAGARARRAGA